MGPEILIVGDEARRQSLAERVRGHGYGASACAPDQVIERVSRGPVPAAIILCSSDRPAAALMTALRQAPHGAAIPVSLFGTFDGEIRDLADVLDLGADHFFEDSVEEDQLRSGLEALAGPPPTPLRPVSDPDEDDEDDEEDEDADSWPARTQVIDEEQTRTGSARVSESSGSDPAIGQLHRSLGLLEERMRHRDPSAADSSDDLDLAALGLDDLPDVEGTGEVLDPAESQVQMEIERVQGFRQGRRPAPPRPRAGTASASRASSRRLGRDASGSASDAWGRSPDDRFAPSEPPVPEVPDATARLDRRPGVRDDADGWPASWSRDRRESTVLLEEGSHPDVRRDRADVHGGPEHAEPGPFTATMPVSSRPDLARDFSSGRLIHDRPRRSAPLPLEDRGSLATFEVPRLIWKLFRARYTGSLSVTRGRVEKTLWFDAGSVIFARSNVGHDRLIDGLLRRGLLTRSQYDTARRMAAKEPRRAGALLVEAGFLKAGELARIVQEHLVRVVDSVFPWNEGNWVLDPAARCEESVVLTLPTPVLLLDGIRNRMESAQLWALLGGMNQHPRLRGEGAERPEALARELRLSPSEARMLSSFTGRRSLEELCSDPRVDELELLGIVYGLHVLELLDLVGEKEPEPTAGHDPVEVDRGRIEERLALARQSDYFSLLGLDFDASRVDVRRAHAELSQTFREENLEPRILEEMADELVELRTALDDALRILSDDALRNAYLAHLEEP